MHYALILLSVREPFVFYSGPDPSVLAKDSHGSCAYLGHQTVSFLPRAY